MSRSAHLLRPFLGALALAVVAGGPALGSAPRAQASAATTPELMSFSEVRVGMVGTGIRSCVVRSRELQRRGARCAAQRVPEARSDRRAAHRAGSRARWRAGWDERQSGVHRRPPPGRRGLSAGELRARGGRRDRVHRRYVAVSALESGGPGRRWQWMSRRSLSCRLRPIC